MIVPYDPDLHRRFVFSAWCGGAGEPFDRLHRLFREGARCAVRVGETNEALFYGYAIVAAAPQTLVWAYTKEKLRGQGIMRALLQHLGVDVKAPMVALFHAPAFDALIAKGWPITYQSDATIAAVGA